MPHGTPPVFLFADPLKTAPPEADTTRVRPLSFKQSSVLAACAATLAGIALAVPATSADGADAPAAAPTEAKKSAVAKKIDTTIKNGPAVIIARMPNGVLDGLAVIEARAAADTTGAPFLSLSATDNVASAELIQRFGVLTTPAVLVVDAENGVRTQINGYADRATVAQAVANARR